MKCCLVFLLDAGYTANKDGDNLKKKKLHNLS